MTTLVPADHEPRVRIGPRVFADVPTAHELETMRKSRNGLRNFVILLIGVLIAAVAGVGFLAYQSKGNLAVSTAQLEELTKLKEERAGILGVLGLKADDVKIGDLDTKVTDLTRERTEIAAEIKRVSPEVQISATPALGELAQAVRQFEGKLLDANNKVLELSELSGYADIHRKQEEAGNLERNIKELLAAEVRKDVPATVKLDTYNGGFVKAWTDKVVSLAKVVTPANKVVNQDWLVAVPGAYDDYIAGLKREEAAILEWRPRGSTEPVPAPRKLKFDELPK